MASPLLRLPREIRDEILRIMLVPKELEEVDWYLKYNKPRYSVRVDKAGDVTIVRNKDSPFHTLSAM